MREQRATTTSEREPQRRRRPPPPDIATADPRHTRRPGSPQKIVERGTVIVANDANYAPQSSIDKATGELVGFDVDVANKMAEILGLTVEFKNPAWETIPAGLRPGQVRRLHRLDDHHAASARRPVATSPMPYYYTSGQVFVKKGGTQITGAADLDGKKVGVGAATTYYDYLKDNTKADVKTYPTDADAFPDLRNGNLDFVMTAGPTGQQAILEGQPFDFSGAPLYYEDLAFAIKKGEGDWLAMLNYAVAEDARRRLAHRDEQEVVQRPRPDGQGVARHARRADARRASGRPRRGCPQRAPAAAP